jgi:hypothetical protein
MHYGSEIKKSYSMTQAEKQVLSDIVQAIHTLTVKIDSVEGALIRSNLLMNGQSEGLASKYQQAANNDLALIRAAIG